MSDSEKLTALAKEVKQMRKLQINYFRVAMDYNKGRAAADEKQKALVIAKDHETRVDILTDRILNRQIELPNF